MTPAEIKSNIPIICSFTFIFTAQLTKESGNRYKCSYDMFITFMKNKKSFHNNNKKLDTCWFFSFFSGQLSWHDLFRSHLNTTEIIRLTTSPMVFSWLASSSFRWSFEDSLIALTAFFKKCFWHSHIYSNVYWKP